MSGFICDGADFLSKIFSYPNAASFGLPLFFYRSWNRRYDTCGAVTLQYDTYYAGVILTMIFGYTFIRIRFIWAGVAGSALLLLYEVCAFGWTDISMPMLINNSFFIVSANFAGMAASYGFEYYARRDFYLVKLLNDEQEKVTLANQLLETRVKERTAELQRINLELEKEIAERKQSDKERLQLQDQLKRAEKMETIGKLASGGCP